MKGTIDDSVWGKNKSLIGTLKDATPPAIICSEFSEEVAECTGSNVGYLYVHADGDVAIGVSDSVYCYANLDGDSNCTE